MTDFKQLNADKDERDWWRGAAIYQIYPRSFQDDTNDGVGDLKGITRRLDYVAELGADAIWISPFYASPMKDFGYDVSDYRAVSPMFGTNEDFEALMTRAHELGIRVIVDLVLSHTSDAHPWFWESKSSRENPKADWYVWADPKPDGTAPNNWLSIFGGSAWQWHAKREQYYLHNFLVEQPDLNFHNPEVQAELLDVAKFWLDMGVDGFRFDTINFFVHDKELRSNPPLAPELRNASIAPSVNPYNHQEHLYDKNRPENLEFLRKMRALMDQYPNTAAVGEVGDAQIGLEILGDYTRGDDLMHMCYAFEFLSGDKLDVSRVESVLNGFAERAAGGYACWAFSNHDCVRYKTRWGLDDAGVKQMAALLGTLPGSICLYQGEELGLPEADLAFEDIQDPYGKVFWPDFKGRDGCRTPMPWTPTAHDYGGFSGHKPWLPVPHEHIERAVEISRSREDSTFNVYKDILAWRKTEAPIVRGDFTMTRFGETGLALTREYNGARVTGYFNLGDTPAVVENVDIIDAAPSEAASKVDKGIEIGANGFVFARG